MPIITNIITKGIRFPTLQNLDYSDAMNLDPDYSAACVILKTGVESLERHGLTFKIDRDNKLCISAI